MMNATPYLCSAMMAVALIGFSSAEDAKTTDGDPAKKTDDYPLILPQMRVRDPFIVVDPASKTYFLYGKEGQNGGHGMIFRDFSGDLRLIFHQPNDGALERAKILKLKEAGDTLVVEKP